MNSSLFDAIGLLVFAVAGLACTSLLLSQIEAEDPSLYERLGRPRILVQKNPFAIFSFWHWLYSERLSKRLSTRTVVTAWTLRVLTPVYVITFLILGSH